MDILNQTISVSQLFNPYSFWIVYFALLYILRKRITSVGTAAGYNESPVGKGFLWTYVFNLPLLYALLKMTKALRTDTDPDMTNEAIFACLAFLISFISVYLIIAVTIVTAIILTFSTFHLGDKFTEAVKWII